MNSAPYLLIASTIGTLASPSDIVKLMPFPHMEAPTPRKTALCASESLQHHDEKAINRPKQLVPLIPADNLYQRRNPPTIIVHQKDHKPSCFSPLQSTASLTMEDHVSNGLVAASIDQCSDSSATFDVELGAQTTVSENCHSKCDHHGADFDVMEDCSPAESEKRLQKFESLFKKLEKWKATQADNAKEDQLQDLQPLSCQLLSDILSLLSLISSQSGISNIPEAHITQCVSILHLQISAAKKVDLSSSLSEIDHHTLDTLRSGMLASNIILKIYTSPGLAKSLLPEEPLESLLDLLKLVVQKFMSVSNDVNEDDQTLNDLVTAASSKSRRPRNKPQTQRQLHISTDMLNILRELLQELGSLVHMANKYPDNIILGIFRCSLQPLLIDCSPDLQLLSINVIRSLFCRYPLFRGMIMDEILHDFLKLSKDRHSISRFKIDERTSIQMSTALILQLLQSIAATPLSSNNNLLSLDNGSTESPSGLFKVASKFALGFLQSLLSKCYKAAELKKEDKQKDLDFRPHVEAFVEDVLLCLYHPEWPIASWVIFLITKLICEKLENEYHAETHLFCLQLVSLILPRLRKEMTALKHDVLFIAPTILPADVDDPDAACPVCNKTCENRPMVSCDTCHRWFHGDCVSVDVDKIGSQSWFCDACLIARQIAELKGRSSTSYQENDESQQQDNADTITSDAATSTASDEEDCRLELARQLILNFLAAKACTDHAVDCARKFLLAEFIHQDPDGANYQMYCKQWCADASKIESNGVPALSITSTTQLISYTHSWLRANDCNMLLKRVLTSIQDKETRVRAKAVRILGAVVEVYPKILGEQHVAEAIQTRFRDSAVSVREATLELIGKYILTTPELASKYYRVIASLLDDEGKSVRKRAVKILQAVCLSQPRSAIVPDLCNILSTKLKDENDNIKSEAIKTFHELWFSTNDIGDLPLVTNDTEHFSPTGSRVEQILNVLQFSPNGISPEAHHSWLTDLLSTLMKNTKYGNHVKATCRHMCQYIIERMIQLEMENQRRQESMDAAQRTSRKESCLLALLLFGKADPSLLEDHIDTLIPCLEQALQAQSAFANATSAAAKAKAEAELESERVITYIISIIELGILHMPNPSEDWVRPTAEKIVKLVNLCKENVIQTGIRCVASIAMEKGLCVSLVSTWYNLWVSYLQQQLTRGQSVLYIQVRRAFMSIGWLLRFYRFDGPFKPEKTVDGARKQHYGDKVEAVMELCKEYWQRFPPDPNSKEANQQSATIRDGVMSAMANICARYPGVFFKQQKLFKDAADKSIDKAIKLRVLNGLLGFLHDEASKTVALSQIQATTTTKAEADENENADSGLTSAVVQAMLPHVTSAVLHCDELVRSAAMQVLQAILGRKIAHPLSVISYVIMLTTDHVLALAEKAAVLLEQLDLFIISHRCAENIKHCYQFHAEVFQKIRPIRTTIIENETRRVSTFAPWYNAIREKSNDKNAMRNFLSGMLKHFEYDYNDEQDLRVEDLVFLRFILLALASLPFKYEDEVLFVIHRINSILLLRTDQLKSYLKKLSARLKTDALTDVDLKYLKAAVAQAFLMRLKRFFKHHYSITDSKLQAYRSDSAIKNVPTNVDITTINFNSEFPSSWLGPVTPDFDRSIPKDAVARLIADFFQEEKQMNVDDFVETATRNRRVTRKRKASAAEPSGPKRKRKRRKLTDSDDEIDDDWDYDSSSDYE